MHRMFRKLLEKATGVSEFIIAVNVDIRDFSSFSKKVESPETTMFIKRVYIKLIDNYFSDASFYKAAGDGLLIIIPYNEENLKIITRRTINSCFKVLREFGRFCKNDPMINFEVPKKVGIGLSRGTACKLISNDKILDYSGKILNLASRLMELARPSGIVFDADFGIELLQNKQIELFVKESVYVKGIADIEPIDIYYTKKSTKISQSNKQPFEKVRWKIFKDTKTLKQLKELGGPFYYDLKTEPKDENQIKVRIRHPAMRRGKEMIGYITTFNFKDFEYFLEAGKPVVNVNFRILTETLEREGIKSSSEIKIEVMYQEK